MISLRFITPVLAALGSIALATGCADDNTDATLRVSNQSDFSIVEIHVTQVGNPNWGPNLLDSALSPSDSVTLGVTCDTYDALLVDETGVDCEVHDLDLCANDADWVIHNDTCAVFGAHGAPTHVTGSAAPDAGARQ
jgi:hypothetical protein